MSAHRAQIVLGKLASLIHISAYLTLPSDYLLISLYRIRLWLYTVLIVCVCKGFAVAKQYRILYLRYDFSLGNAPNIFEQCIQGNADGTFTYGKYEGALQKFAAYVPLHPIWGDINHDGTVSVSDVMALVDWVLGQEIETLPKAEADLNVDGGVSVADVMMLVDYLLLH